MKEITAAQWEASSVAWQNRYEGALEEIDKLKEENAALVTASQNALAKQIVDKILDERGSTNQELANQILFQDIETGEELHPIESPYSKSGALVLIVANKDGSRKWKHRIFTEEY
jgi:Mn-containing catalase